MDVFTAFLIAFGAFVLLAFLFAVFLFLSGDSSEEIPEETKSGVQKRSWKKYFSWGWWTFIGILALQLFWSLVIVKIPAPWFSWFWTISLWRWAQITLVIGSFLYLFWTKRDKSSDQKDGPTTVGKSAAPAKDLYTTRRLFLVIIPIIILVALQLGGVVTKESITHPVGLYFPVTGMLCYTLAWTSVIAMWYLVGKYALFMFPAMAGSIGVFVIGLMQGWPWNHPLLIPGDPRMNLGVIVVITLLSALACGSGRNTRTVSYPWIILLVSFCTFAPQAIHIF